MPKAEYGKDGKYAAKVLGRVTCKTCGLCAIANRKAIIGFPAHGPSKRKASAIAAA